MEQNWKARRPRQPKNPFLEPESEPVPFEPASEPIELEFEPVERPAPRNEGPAVEFELVDDPHRSGRDEGGREIGPDLVLFFRQKIVVCSPKQMHDWEARNFEKPKILFEGDAYYLSRRLPGDEDRPFRYELLEWPAYIENEPKHVIDYNEDYVEQRDGRFKKVKSKTGHTSRLTFLYPFLGFVWSGTKKRFLEPHGFNPVRISLFSCIFAYAIFMAELISFFFFASGVLQWSSGNHLLWLDYTFLLVLPVDAAVRFFQIVNGTARYPDGFLEWIPNFFRQRREERIVMHDDDEGEEDRW